MYYIITIRLEKKYNYVRNEQLYSVVKLTVVIMDSRCEYDAKNQTFHVV